MNRPVVRALLVSIALSLVGLGFALWSLGGPRALLKVGDLQPAYLLLAVLMLGASFVLSALRLVYICRLLGARLKLRHAVRAHVIGMFSAAVTPGGTGNLAGVALSLDLQGVDAGRAWAAALATMSSDTTFHAWAMPISLVGLYALGAYPTTLPWLVIGIVSIVLTVAFAYVLLFKVPWLLALVRLMLRGPLLRFRRAGIRLVEGIVGSSRTFAAASIGQHVTIQALSAAAWVAFFLILHFLLVGLGVDLGVWLALAGQTVIAVLSTFVPTPGASGFLELVLSGLLIKQGSGEAGPAAVLAWRLITYYSVFLLGPMLGGFLILTRAKDGVPRGHGGPSSGAAQ